MVPHTWQSPSSPPPQSPLTSQQPPISLLFTNLLFNPQSSPLSEESIFFHLIPLPSHFRFSRGCLFHTTRAHTASSFSFRWNPTPWRNNHLRRLVILRHTSPPMLATLWNKRHVTSQPILATKWCQHEMMLLSVFVFLDNLNQFYLKFQKEKKVSVEQVTQQLWICHLSGWLAKYHCYRLPLVSETFYFIFVTQILCWLSPFYYHRILILSGREWNLI